MPAVTVGHPTILTADDVASLTAASLGKLTGVENRVLWQNGTSMAGVLTVAGGHQLGEHTHRANHHHMWILEGDVVICGRKVGPGSYVHIPAGVAHDLDATSTRGCTVFYLYIRPGE